MDVSEKKYAEKRLFKMFLTKDEVFMKVKTLVKKYQCEIFNFMLGSDVIGVKSRSHMSRSQVKVKVEGSSLKVSR